ncbi:ABC transporter permease [Streptomyces sp. WAC05374]|uniref:ABC transporter permease n=1 Tax=unclassified Streptomyces TaxID=2593676 RepID=UPI000F88C53D|nr:ABC transporter permease [Streptomyces sp. WAC05374]RST14655.1 ABC transporter permease [Streptomyces sp. WAC05374]TDF43311.1 ABC transporter permease [Streptomyces sp. WAC05374]TDF51097.1 ABC transporter permease [Streptomyces sp. WAC05374]TDF52160.1 ABC transporter permease [Streptomyces sp. WAC05374]
MGRYVIRRLLQAIPVLLGATILIYCLVFLLPGDPIQALAGEKKADPNITAILREQYHLNDPLYQRYWYYISGVLTGDFGTDFTGRPVAEIMSETFPVTLNLAAIAFAVEAVIGIVAGVFAALGRGKFLDNVVLLSTLLLVSVPVFVLGNVLQLVLGVKWAIAPISYDSEDMTTLILPAVVLASASLAYITRLTRTSMMETMRADYVRTATAKGLSRSRVIVRHALRNAMIPIVTFLGVDLGALMGGAIITERIFNIPGIGGTLYQAVYLRQGTTVVSIVTVLVLVYIAANLIVDLLYAVLDPRIRYA